MFNVTIDINDSPEIVKDKLQPLIDKITDLMLKKYKFQYMCKEYLYIHMKNEENEHKTFQVSIKESI
ncbi:MAG: hypothetical protein EBU66_13535 [Bacteroidetes bacterium]|nr:hypothetical protein [bacterium]NBP65668.1 hypothetical protein [Bacteroidota bacterium]